MVEKVYRYTACELHRALQQGELSLNTLVDTLLYRIQVLNPSVNAFVAVDKGDVINQADDIVRRLKKGERLPLFGAVFSLKDNLWRRGYRATFGSQLFRNHIAPKNSAVVDRLLDRGAICIGMTNCAEFACKGHTSNPLHGVTRNPWDLETTPGGSSGGAAAAVASGLAPVALGTDAGGSVRRPAAHTGLVGFKPTHGLIPDPHGFDDPSYEISDIGVLTRSVKDAAWFLDHMVHYDRRDPRSHPVGGELAKTCPFTRNLAQYTSRSLRIGWSLDLGCGFRVDPSVGAAFTQLMETLSKLGWNLTGAAPAWPSGTHEYPLVRQQQATLAAHYSAILARQPHLFDPAIAEQIKVGQQVTGIEYAADELRRKHLYQALDSFFNRFDFLICPTAPVEAWSVSEPYPATIEGIPASSRGHAAFTPLFNYCEVPALSLPFGFGGQLLPLGLQIIGPRNADVAVVTLAYELERVLNISFQSPLFKTDTEELLVK